jgi:hypothetical protein
LLPVSIVELSDKVSKSMMVMAAAWAFILTFIIIADITSRGLFNDPLNGTREIVANSIVMIVFLQAGYAIRSLTSLDMVFIAADGRVHRIAERTVPYSLATIPSNGPVRATLELAAGTAERLNIRVGDRVLHPIFGSQP